jgi:hypothetical protein
MRQYFDGARWISQRDLRYEGGGFSIVTRLGTICECSHALIAHEANIGTGRRPCILCNCDDFEPEQVEYYDPEDFR